MVVWKKMRRIALFGAVMVLALTLGVVVPVFGATAADIDHAVNAHHKAPLLAKGTTLTISGSGTAYKIGDKDDTATASLSLTATVVGSSPGRGMLNLTSGTMTVGSDTYTAVRGHGVINYHSDKMTLHLVVKNSAGKEVHLILHGHNAKASQSSAFTVDFAMPQSKLGHLWFLKIQGATVTPK
jgi:hypothetical protein